MLLKTKPVGFGKPYEQMTFGDRLLELKAKSGLSYAKLAELTGIPKPTLVDYARGRRQPSLNYGLKIARALKVSADSFSDCEFGEPRANADQ